MNIPTVSRIRWSAIGAAVAVCLGAGGIGFVNASLVPADDGSVYVAITPCRLVDTRLDFQVGGRGSPLGADETYGISGRGSVGNCTIPSEALALALNVTATDATQATFIAVWESGSPRPNASSLNPAPNQPPAPNAVTTRLGADGMFNLFNKAGTVNLFADVVGYYTDHDHDDRYYTQDEVDSALGALDFDGRYYTESEVDTLLNDQVDAPPASLTINTYDFQGGPGNTHWSLSANMVWTRSAGAPIDCIYTPVELPVGVESIDATVTYHTAVGTTMVFNIGGRQSAAGAANPHTNNTYNFSGGSVPLPASVGTESRSVTVPLNATNDSAGDVNYAARLCTSGALSLYGVELDLTYS